MLTRALRKKFLKIVLAGDQAVGKTSLRKRYLGESFEGKYMLTIGTEFSLKKLFLDGDEFSLQIWDLAGQQQFRHVRTLYYQGARGAIIVYDVTKRETFENIPRWISELITHNNNQLVPILIVANKIDLREIDQSPVITTEEGIAFAKTLEEEYTRKGFDTWFIYHETSAKTGCGVEEAITNFVSLIMSQRKMAS